jgi:hypothetical protein
VKRSVRDESTWVVTHFVHGSNARNLSVQLSLFSTSKNALSFLLCLCLLFNKIGDKGRTGSAWKQGGMVGRGSGGEQGEGVAQTMYAHVNKCIKNFFKKSNLKSKIF